MRRIALATLAACLLPATAEAHLTMAFPTNRYGEEQKFEPCGRAGGARTDQVSVFAPGETITIEFTETIDHPSHYRVSFDEDGEDDFCYPADKDDLFTCESVILDGIADDPASAQTIEFTFPEVECDNCTLQVVQVMYDKVASGWGDNDLYFNCADIVLRAPDPNAPDAGPDDPPVMNPDGGGCAVTASDSDSAPVGLLLLVAAIALSSRRR